MLIIFFHSTIINIPGWISKNHLCEFSSHKSSYIFWFGRIATHKSVIAKLIYISKLCYWWIFKIRLRSFIFHNIDKFFNWRNSPVKIKSVKIKVTYFISQKLIIPSRLIEFVIKKSQLLNLFFCQIIHSDNRDLTKLQLFCSQKPAVSDYKDIILVNYQRLSKTESIN